MMNRITIHAAAKFLTLLMMVGALPTLLLGDVHFENSNHPPCENEHQQTGESLPWHPHGECDSDVENFHPDLKTHIQKNDSQIGIELYSINVLDPLHDHNECHIASTVTKNVTTPYFDILTQFNTLLI
jgi:hypothetical protein